MEFSKDRDRVQESDRPSAALPPEVLDKAEILAISESALQKDWLKPKENEAWQHL
jgi:hypothetical protein